ncbi:BatD family protein [Emticicia aquatica]|uniref:BatD family protein n=1 Tax=Emticicia aquatica TaxID=1681835 RepID=UPI001EEC2226|nr:BatD family protein [Emticicia aquatica]
MAQQEEVKIELGKRNILIDENFTVKVIIKNTDKSSVSSFPDFPNFTKGAKQKVFSKNPVGYTITQSYTAIKEGNFKIPSFTLNVNGKEYNSEAFNIIVTQPKEVVEEEKTETLIEKSGRNAFLAMTVNKSKVYVGEGFRVFLAFYVAENNTVQMDFPDDLNAQVDAIAKKIKSTDCLEERITITNLVGEPSTINGKKYLAYKFFEALYFPLNNKPVNIPAVSLKMLQASKKNTAKETVNFTDIPQTINVLDLPEHPLKDKVSAGNFSLGEQIETHQPNTGKSFSYSFRIVGDGNFSTVNTTPPSNDSFFDFYPPEIKEIHTNAQPTREKQFRYRILPKDSGQYQLDKYFYWVFFNTKTEKYDTLKSKIKIKVLGKTIANKDSDSSNDIFAGIEKLDTTHIETNYQEVMKNILNLIIICMIIGSLYLFNWNSKNKNSNDA